MKQLYLMVATGTAATLLATALFLLRVKFHGNRPALVLIRRWLATSFHTCGLVLVPLVVIAVSCFAGVVQNEWNSSSGRSTLRDDASTQIPASDSNGSGPVQALDSLRAYADSIGANRETTAAQSPAPNSAELPDVETMIMKLVTRLEKDPNDVNGWKMLGWSYLNTDKPDDAAKAYETALKLDPDNMEIKKALEQAKSAQIAAINLSSDSPSQPATENAKSPEDLSVIQRNDMIHGMVDKLAARLEKSPNDENGWLSLMSSRMTLGDKDAAKATLTKALAAFANDAEITTRLNAAARELGLDSD
ncbi:MAG: tetratricopeptide repeat protein [Proteobacteria bacterium]|nr:tetratricopeptide repeat protein [Pseudomonadota bacterium]